jgi:hypothetical protein
MSPVRDERKPYDIPHDRILRNHEITSVAFFRPSCLRGAPKRRFGATAAGAWWCWPVQPTVETVGYCRSSLAGLQNGMRRVKNLFALADQLEAGPVAAQRQAQLHSFIETLNASGTAG